MRRFLAALTLSVLSICAAAQAEPLTTQDHIEIEQLYAKYNTALDAGDAEGWAGTFTPDGVFNNMAGREALVKFATAFHERGGGKRRHWNSNLLIQGDGTKATGSVYLMLWDVGSKPATIMTTGIYADELVKTAQGWRFAKRAVKGDAPAAPAAPQAPAAPAQPKS